VVRPLKAAKGQSSPKGKYGLSGASLVCMGPPPLSAKVLEPCRRQLCVAHCVADRLVTEIRLQGSGIDPVVGELKAGSMAQHVRMHRKAQLCCFASPLY
jgi:hypothetical protein